MKIVVNSCYGGFHVPEELQEKRGLRRYDCIDRTDPELVAFVEAHGGEYEEDCAFLEIVEIPDEATDWILNEYDGMESVIYVVDGKIHWGY